LLDLLEATRRCHARGVTVVAVLHDLNLAALFAGRIVVLDQGRIVADGRPAEIISDSMLEQVFGVTGAIGRVPSPGLPFVLPHAMARMSGTSTRTSPRP
jgi:iron complex transport system ATP-binding protein